MGKGGRIACIFVPMALTVVALVLLSIVGLGQTNASNHYLSSIYMLKANVGGAANHPELLSNPPNNETSPDDVQDGHIVLYNNYTVGLWNYCAGGGVVSNSSNTNTSDPASHIAFCTGRQTQFAFNPEIVWGLPETFTTRFFSSQLSDSLDAYEHGLSKAIGPLYIVTVASAAISVLVGLAAIFSRIGSIVTTLAALFTTAMAFGFAGVSTAAYFSLRTVFNEALEKEDITFEVGETAFAMTWVSVAALLVGSLFWAFSSCCVSGRSNRKDRVAQAGQWGTGYKRMDQSPNPGGWNQEVPLTAYGAHHGGAPHGGPAGGAYEPYRHV